MEYTYEYQEVTNPITGEVNKTVMRSDGALIPCNEGNSDYQEYLKSLDETATL
jgi:hypothetical protein